MGSPFAPSVAKLFMANLKNTIILNDEQNPFFSSVFFYFIASLMIVCLKMSVLLTHLLSAIPFIHLSNLHLKGVETILTFWIQRSLGPNITL